MCWKDFEMMLVKWIHLRQLTPLSDVIAGMEGGGSTGLRPPAASPKPPAPETRRPQQSVAPPPARPPVMPAASSPHPVAASQPPAAGSASPVAAGSHPVADLKTALMSAIREGNKTFFGMYVAQAQSITADHSSVTFTFAPAHKSLASQFESRRSWLEQLAQSVSGRRIAIHVKEAPASAAPAAPDPAASKQAELVARAKAEPSVQAMLDVFGGEIQQVEEIE